MSSSVILVALVSLASLSSPVIGDPTTIMKFTYTNVTNYPNEYFDPWSVDIIETKRSSKINLYLPVKKELPPAMTVKFSCTFGDQLYEHSIGLCDAWIDPVIGQSFTKNGAPKDTFPQACPIGPGEWSILKWDPPADKLPPGIPDGDFSGFGTIEVEGEETPFVRVDFGGQVSHSIPGIGG